jgi:hypothetical protein
MIASIKAEKEAERKAIEANMPADGTQTAAPLPMPKAEPESEPKPQPSTDAGGARKGGGRRRNDAGTSKTTSPTGLQVTYDSTGKAIQWRWTVGGKGTRGTGYKDVAVPEGQHRGHVKSVNEGAGVNTVDDAAPNIVPQSSKVNLSNVKRFENWRVANAQGQQVIVTQLPNGYQRWQIPGKNIDVTFNPQSTTRWPDNWFLQGGTYD